MSLYDRYIFPRIVNCECGSPVIEHQRRLVVPRAFGLVLRIGFGSGLNLPHYYRGSQGANGGSIVAFAET